MVGFYFNVDVEILRRISTAVLICISTYFFARIMYFLLERLARKPFKFFDSNSTKYVFSKHFLVACIYFLGFCLVIYFDPVLRTFSATILAGAGFFAIVLGFAFQSSFVNIISGIFIVTFKPFRVGDKVRLGDEYLGIIEDITLRHTVIRTYENKRIVIPNSMIANEKIENYNLGEQKICKFIEFGISYDSNIDKAKKIMRKESEKHPFVYDNRNAEEKESKKPIVIVRVINLTDSAVVLRAWVWAKNPLQAFEMGCDLKENIKKAFDKNGIEIPFPHRTVVFKEKGKIK